MKRFRFLPRAMSGVLEPSDRHESRNMVLWDDYFFEKKEMEQLSKKDAYCNVKRIWVRSNPTL